MAATVFSRTKPDFNQTPKVPIVLLQFPALSLAFLQLPFPPPALSFEVDAGGQRCSNLARENREKPVKPGCLLNTTAKDAVDQPPPRK